MNVKPDKKLETLRALTAELDHRGEELAAVSGKLNSVLKEIRQDVVGMDRTITDLENYVKAVAKYRLNRLSR